MTDAAPEQQVVMVPVPELSVVKLPRCANPDCPDPVHPLAREGQHDPAICPGCGGPAAEPCEAQVVEPVVSMSFADSISMEFRKVMQ